MHTYLRDVAIDIILTQTPTDSLVTALGFLRDDGIFGRFHILLYLQTAPSWGWNGALQK
jgi:hypothetical protein